MCIFPGIEAKGTGELKVMNALGQVELSKQVTIGAGQQFGFPVQSLKEGIYFIEISELTPKPIAGLFVKH